MKKSKSQLIHTKNRAIEKFGIPIERCHINKIINEIQNQSNHVKFISKPSNRVSLWKVDIGYIFNGEFDGKAIVAYDKERKTIATIYPAQN